MKFEIENKTVEITTIPIDVQLEKTEVDIVLKVNGLYILAIKKDGTGVLYGGLENNNCGLQADSSGKLKVKKC